MPRATWRLQGGRPVVQIVLTLAIGGQALSRSLLADTGAGSRKSGFDLILDEDDCLLSGGFPALPVSLSGAFSGPFPRYDVEVQVSALGFARV